MLVAPYKKVSENKIESDFSKLLLLKVTQDDQLFLENDPDIVRNIIFEIQKNNH